MTTRFVNDRAPGYAEPYTMRGSRYRAICSDGVVRVATVTADSADTFFSIPARVQVRGRTVSGYVTGVDWYERTGSDDQPADIAPAARYEFRQYSYRRNADALPDWS